MESETIFERVPVDKIDLDNHKFRISTGDPSESLVASIKLAGVLTPPILLQEKHAFIVVSGFKRIDAVQRLGIENIIAQILSPQTTVGRCINIAIIDNVMQRELNQIEQGHAFQLLASLYQDASALCEKAEELGLPNNIGVAKKLRTAAQMPIELQQALIDGQIALPIALQLNDMDDWATANQLSTLISQLGLSLNRQRELLEWLVGISHREGIPVSQVINCREMTALLSDPDMDRKQMSMLVRQYLKKRRYPEISKAENRYYDVIRALHLENGVQLIAPPHFEGLVYSFKIDFKNHQELISKYRQLESVLESAAFKSLWDDFGVA